MREPLSDCHPESPSCVNWKIFEVELSHFAPPRPSIAIDSNRCLHRNYCVVIGFGDGDDKSFPENSGGERARPSSSLSSLFSHSSFSLSPTKVSCDVATKGRHKCATLIAVKYLCARTGFPLTDPFLCLIIFPALSQVSVRNKGA